jgi:hypothetical protein
MTEQIEIKSKRHTFTKPENQDTEHKIDYEYILEDVLIEYNLKAIEFKKKVSSMYYRKTKS